MRYTAIPSEVIRTANRLMREIRALPLEALKDTLRIMDAANSRMPASAREVCEDTAKGIRLVIQWSNQAREQTLSDKELGDKFKEAMPDLIADLKRRMREGGL